MKEQEITEILGSVEPMIKRIAHKWAWEPRVPFDDLMNIGRDAAVRAIIGFDDSRGTKLTTYMYTCIENAMIEFFQSNRYQLHSTPYFQKKDLELIKEQEYKMVSMNKLYADDATISDILPVASGTPAEEACRSEEREILLREIDALPEREKYILKESNLWFGDKTLEEIGDKLGVTKQCISQNIKRIIGKLRNKLEVLNK